MVGFFVGRIMRFGFRRVSVEVFDDEYILEDVLGNYE